MSSNPMPKSGSPVSMMMPSPEDEELPPGIVFSGTLGKMPGAVRKV